MSYFQNHRILLVDDNTAIHEDIRKILSGTGSNPALADAETVLFDAPKTSAPLHVKFEIDSAYQGQQGIQKVDQAVREGRPYAMAFIDVRMPPGWDGIETIEHLWRSDPALQVVLCTAYSDYSWERMTARLGINENLVILKKPFDNIEVLQIAHALTKKWEMTHKASLRLETLDQMVNQRTAELRRSEERFSKAFRSNPFPFVIQTLRNDCFVDVNDAFERMTGFSRSELAGRTPLEAGLSIDYNAPSEHGCDSQKAANNIEATISTKSGELRQVRAAREPIALDGESHVLVMMQDITDQLRIETELRQAQKMEAIGQLAAGVAHDFNNLLTVIEGHASLQLSMVGNSKKTVDSFNQINAAAERAAELTRKLLSFSRRQILCPQVINLNSLIGELSTMLSRLIGEGVTLHCELEDSLPPIYADQTNIEQIIMNLVLNARDAMPQGGAISISTAEVRFTEGDCGPEARPGSFVCLKVKDNGMGIDEKTRKRMFEPFFTTKEVDKGTGMGLATVYGVVRQHEGWINVLTAPGQGAEFSIFLPLPIERLKLPDQAAPARPSQRPLCDHTLLVVEDDESVRSVVCTILGLDGYTVLQAGNADEAMAIWQDQRDKIDLVLTDVMMPGTANGIELASKLLADKPELKIIYTSGYSIDLFTNDFKLQEGVNYLPKPYLSSKLIDILRKAI